MTRLIRGRAGPLSEIVAEARAVGRRSVMLAEMAFLNSQLAQLRAANRAQDVTDKAYVTEQRLNALWNHLGPYIGGGNGQRLSIFITSTQTISSTSEAVVGVNSVPLTWTVVPGKYLLYAEITYVPNVSADSACLRLSAQGSGMTVSSLRANFKQYNGTGVVSVNNNAVTALSADMQSSTMSSGTTAHFEFWCPFTVSVGGTISVTARILTSNADTYVIQLGTFGTLESVGQTT